MNQHIGRIAVFAAAGLVLGAAVGHTIGRAIRSDNLPFLNALGAAVGLGVGLAAVAIWWAIKAARRPC